MAIIVVVTVPTIINTIADARVNSIWNLANATANSYDTLIAQDLLSTNKKLTGYAADINVWNCIAYLKLDDEQSNGLADILGLSEDDIKFDGNEPDDRMVIDDETCSSIKLNTDGTAVVLLVAADGGKFDVANKVVYAVSSAANGVSKDESAD